MKNKSSKTQKMIKIRIAVLVDADGNWSAAGQKGDTDKESIEVAQECDALSGIQQAYYLTIEVPGPLPVELSAALVETAELITSEAAA